VDDGKSWECGCPSPAKHGLRLPRGDRFRRGPLVEDVCSPTQGRGVNFVTLVDTFTTDEPGGDFVHAAGVKLRAGVSRSRLSGACGRKFADMPAPPLENYLSHGLSQHVGSSCIGAATL
jgi:hypothetical protein